MAGLAANQVVHMLIIQLAGLAVVTTTGDGASMIAMSRGCPIGAPGLRGASVERICSLRGGGRALSRGPATREDAAQLKLTVRGLEESPGMGDGGGLLVLMHVSGPCTQEDLDARVERGQYPAVVFDDAETATRFNSYRNANVQMEMRVVSSDAHPASGGSVRNQHINGGEQQGGSAFFDAYDNIAVHTLMIQDTPRTLWYQKEIEGKPHIFRGAVVLDVGAGTGILSMFAAQAGAKKVYAVEAASKVADLARRLVHANGLDDTIQVINKKIEDVFLHEKVDVIVSEWMGFYLLHESMIHSVITARDSFLKHGGLMLPHTVRIYAAPSSMDALWRSRVTFWDNRTATYGLDMSLAGPAAAEETTSTPIIETVDHRELLADPQIVWSADMNHVTHQEAQVHVRLIYSIPRSGVMRGVCLWFAVSSADGMILSTGPSEQPTHWKQTCVMFGKEVFLDAHTTVGLEVEIEPSRLGGSAEERLKTISVGLFDPGAGAEGTGMQPE